MGRVIHFEIHAENPERAISFYQAMFGWSFQKWNGPMGVAPEHGQAVNAHVCTVDVPALDACVAKVPTIRGSIALAKMPIPGIGWLAYARDTEGNIFGMMQHDPQAK